MKQPLTYRFNNNLEVLMDPYNLPDVEGSGLAHMNPEDLLLVMEGMEPIEVLELWLAMCRTTAR